MSRVFSVEPEPLPFAEAIEAFRGRLPLSPEEYHTLSDEAKTRAFTLSGVASEDLIGEVFKGIDRAIAEGETFESFSKTFLQKLEKAWGKDAPHRLRTVFETNVQSSYQAGRYKALTDPAVLAERNLFMYDAVNDGRTRPAHRALDGKVVRADDPFWDTHYPPNGWRCRCGVISLTEAGAAERGLEPATREEAAELSRNHLPDKGFAVNGGKATWGETIAESVLAESGERWQPLLRDPKGPSDYGRPELIPMSERPVALLPTIAEAGGRDAFLKVLAERWGGDTITALDPRGEGVIASRVLLEHLKEDGRERFLSLVPDLVANPFEIWVMPLKDTVTGRVTLRRRYLKSYQDERRRNLLLAAEVRKGVLEAWTMFETRDPKYFQRQRVGILLWGE